MRRCRMRWQQLFADLGAQFTEAEAAADRTESASRTRAEMGAVRLALDDGSVLIGTIARVGADCLEVASHAPDEPRRAGAVRGVYAAALDGVALIRTAPPGLD